MKSPIIKIAIAAVITIACLIGLSLWTDTGSGIALGDVLTRIQEMSAFTYETTQIHTGQEGTNRLSSSLISKEHGMRIAFESIDPNTGEKTIQQELYMSLKEKTATVLLHDKKIVMNVAFDHDVAETMRQEIPDPREMLKQIQDCQYESLGPSIVDGIAVEGFHTSDPNYLRTGSGQVDVTIWVDSQSKLPVRLEEIIYQNGQTQKHMISSNFQWNIPVSASQFEPDIPDDYTSPTSHPFQVPAMNEGSALEDLRAFLKEKGAYPKQIPNMVGMYVTGIPEGMTHQEVQKYVQDPRNAGTFKMKIMTGSALRLFYRKLTQANADPAYYGEFVTPEDADQVLMRWKVSDNEYRVIFGNLHAETVTADVLAELEKNLPK